MAGIFDGIKEQEAARRNAYLRQVYGPLQSYALWRPSDIDMSTCHEWWESVRDDETNSEANDDVEDAALFIQQWWWLQRRHSFAN